MGLTRELAFQARVLTRRPGVPLLIALTVAIGLAGVLTVLAVADALYGRPLPYRDDHRLALVFSAVPDEGRLHQSISPLNYADWRAAARTVDLEAVSTPRRFLLSEVEHPRNLTGEYVSSGYFSLLGIGIARGRGFDPDDDRPGAAPIVVVSHRLWREELGGDPAAVGGRLRLADRSFEIVGVLEPSYRGILWDPVDLWVPLAQGGEILGERYRTDRAFGWHLAVARVRDGFSLAQARGELDELAARLERQHPRENRGKRTTLEPLRDFYFGDELRRGLTYLVGAALFVALLVAVNVLCLALGQIAERAREIAARRAFGASRAYLAATLLGALAPPLAVGFALALAGAWWLAPRLIGMSDIPPATLAARWIDLRTASAGLALVVLLGAVVGAIAYRSLMSLPLGVALRASGRSSGARLRSLRRFVLVETTLAVVLLVGAGLLLRSLARLGASDPGFDAPGLSALPLDLQPGRYDDPAERARFGARLLEGAAVLPAVTHVALAGPDLPPRANRVADLTPEDARDDRDTFPVYRHAVSPGFVTALGVPLLEGRDLAATDRAGAPTVALVSRTVAQRLGGGARVLGRRFRLRPQLPGDPWWTVIGVLADVAGRDLAPGQAGEPDIFLPYDQAPEHAVHLLVRTSTAVAGTADLARDLHREVRRLDRDLALAPVETMTQRYAQLTADHRFHATVAACFSALATALAGLGLFGVLDLSVRARRQELGIRLAFGAHPGRLLRMVLEDGLRMAALGLGAGLALSLLLNRYLQSILFGVAAHDPLTLLLVAAIVLVTAVVAAVVPALRARGVDATAELVRPA
ncbi:MAG TPA: ABC transporter permease [Thermoanaerobaculia bacterium]|nr:ABC transporter permease [Thermoanaerobaculia bacterium]